MLPILACPFSGPTAWWMAYDIGFFTAQMRSQVFHPSIPETEFDEVVDEFGLHILRHEGFLDGVVSWLASDLRKPPPSSPRDPDVPWYRRQVERFRAVAPAILAHDSLAGGLKEGVRVKILASFRKQVEEIATWPLRGGW